MKRSEDMSQPINDLLLPNHDQFSGRWKNLLEANLPQYREQINRFFADTDMGFMHSYKVFRDARALANIVEQQERRQLDNGLIEQIAVFHDIGKFFQDLHSLENTFIAEGVYRQFGQSLGLSLEVIKAGTDGIRNSDFYNFRLNPTGQPPTTLEGEIVRTADKMQDNIVAKVDRYWYKYGVPRGATFFDPNLTDEKRDEFSFENFVGDQLNVILTIIGIRPEDFNHPAIQDAYRAWSVPAKQQVVQRIYGLANELGEAPTQLQQLQGVVTRYRQRHG